MMSIELLTPNMKRLYYDIVASLGQLPVGKKEFLFGRSDEEDMDLVKIIADYITFEFIKYAHDSDDEKFSVRHFYDDNGKDDERGIQTRNRERMVKYKKAEIERNKEVYSEQKDRFKDMSIMKNRMEGHEITKMNFLEQNIFHDVKVLEKIVNGRITDSDSVSGKDFIRDFKEYDDKVKELMENSKKSDEDMVFYSLAFFTLEWHFGIETFYKLACMMEEDNVQEIDFNRLIMLCSRISIESRFGGWVHTDSRMARERILLLPYLYLNGDKDIMPSIDEAEEKEEVFDKFREIIVLVEYYKSVYECKSGGLYKEWFKKESNMQDWASFLRYYDIFMIWEEKEWPNLKRIKNMRKIFKGIMAPFPKSDKKS